MCACSPDTLNPKEPLGRLIYHMAQDLGRYAERILKPFDLTLEQLHILKVLPDVEGMTQKAIGVLVNKTPANMTRILDRLEEKKLLRRHRDPGDRRATLILITEEGKRLTTEVACLFDGCSEQFLAGISLKEQEIIRSSFRKMSENLNTLMNSKP